MRIMDLSRGRNLSVGKDIIKKMEYYDITYSTS
jgi:hypothetical protein